MGYCATEQVWPMDTAPEALRTPETRRCGFKLPRGSSPLSRFIAAPLSALAALAAAPCATLRHPTRDLPNNPHCWLRNKREKSLHKMKILFRSPPPSTDTL